MEFPVEIGFGTYAISAHLLFETAGFIIGYRYYVYLKSKSYDPISDSNRLWILIGAAAGAFLFSRILGTLEDPISWFEGEHKIISFYASKTVVGALLGGLLGVEIMKHFIGEKNSSGDLMVQPLIVAMMIGRIGCFLNGVYENTFGIETKCPFGLDLGDGLLRHPVALYEIVFLALLLFLLTSLKRKLVLQNGALFKFFMLAYLLFRFNLDFIKPRFEYFLGIGAIQISCIIGLIYYRKTIFKLLTSPSKLLSDAK